MKTKLSQQKCIPCEGGVSPLSKKESIQLLKELNKWQLIDNHHIEKEFSFNDFANALNFTNKIGELAEKEGHHPDIYLAWGKVKVSLWTHKINGLTKSDFILASKIDVIS